MLRILNIGKSGLSALQNQLDLISNNIANTQTDGYKKMELQFESLLADSIKNNGVPLSDKLRNRDIGIGTGSKNSDSFRNNDQGVIEKDENPFALAIQGEGYFGIVDKSENKYLSRNGQFNLSEEGLLIDSKGNQLDIDYFGNNMINSDFKIEISEDGTVIEKDTVGQENIVGKIKLYDTEKYSLLVENGSGYLTADKIIEIDLSLGESIIKQGYIEKSNVDISEELIKMLTTQRAYELNTRTLRAADEMWSLANNMRR